MNDNFIQSVESIDKGRLWTSITSGFAHQNWWHIGFNMATFIGLFPLLVHGMPHVKVPTVASLLFGSLLSGSAASYVHGKAIGGTRPGLGASGMLCGFFAALIIAFPTARVTILGINPFQLWQTTLFCFVVDSALLGA